MIHHAIILAGGEGTRLRPVTYEIPKPLIPVQGQPILTWQARWLARYGVQKITVIITPKWREAFARWRVDAMHACPMHIQLFEEPEPMGTMGAMIHHLIGHIGDEPIFLTNGDELKGLHLGDLAAFHEKERSLSDRYAVTIALIQVSNPSDYGVAELTGKRIKAFHEKPANPPSNLINAGLYIMEPAALREISRDKKFLMFEKDLFPRLAQEGRLGGCALDGPWYDCGTMERWERAMREWKAPM